MGNTLLKIAMPSAPSVSIAPFDAQTIGLTDWDNDITANTVVSIIQQIKHPCKSACVQVKVAEDSTATK